MEEMLIGVTDRSLFFFIPDPASLDGSGKTGLVAANLTCSYARMEDDNDATVTDVTSSLNDLAALTSTHNDWGLKEISSTLAPGLYRLDSADAVFASGAWYAVIYLMITTSAAAAVPKIFRLVAINALDGVRFGLTALPNAAAEAAGGLYTRGTGAGQINQPANGMADTNLVRWLGTAASTPTVAGVPNVNAKTWNDLTTVELPLVPTTAGRKLDVSAGGEAGLDWANVGSPTTVVGLSGTTVKTATDVETDTQDIQSRLPAALGANGNIKADVRDYNGTAGMFAAGRPEVNASHAAGTAWNSGAIGPNTLASDTLTAAKIAADAIGSSELSSGAANKIRDAVFAEDVAGIDFGANEFGQYVQDTFGIVNTRLPAALVSGRMDSSVGAMAANTLTATAIAADAITAAKIASDAIGASELAADAVAEIQSGLSTLTQANIRTAVGLASANLDTQLNAIDDFLDTEIAAIKAKTDNLPSDPADASDIAALFAAAPAALLDLANGVEMGLTLRQWLRLLLAVWVGVSDATDPEAGTAVFKRKDETTTALTTVYNAQGDRTSVTYGTLT